MAKIRVLVVEDSPTVRQRLCEVLASDPDLEVVGQAEDGKTAIALCQALRPDVVTLDMMLPVMTGLAATEYIMAHCPTPILIVSASTNRGELFRTYEALAAGAVDVLEKPKGDEPDGLWERKFLSTIKLVSRIRVITHIRARLGLSVQPYVGPTMPQPPGGRPPPDVVAIGASTGGPAAISQVVSSLPPDFRVPLVVVLHIGEPFAPAFADWLAGQVGRSVTFAQGGESVAAHAGAVLVAPPDRHLVVEAGRTRLTRDPERHSCRPSVDVLFESVAEAYGPKAVACLLTGMGRDGATGLLRVRQTGGATVAQDEATSVVYGMPGEAAKLGAAERILPLSAIARFLADARGARATQ